MRAIVAKFAEAMESKLVENDDLKESWHEYSLADLLGQLADEMGEFTAEAFKVLYGSDLKDPIEGNKDNVLKESGDILNIVMFICEKCGCFGEQTWDERGRSS